MSKNLGTAKILKSTSILRAKGRLVSGIPNNWIFCESDRVEVGRLVDAARGAGELLDSVGAIAGDSYLRASTLSGLAHEIGNVLKEVSERVRAHISNRDNDADAGRP